MADFRNMRPAMVTRADATIDQGLRSYMIGVYNLMAIALVITAFVAMGTAYMARTNETFFLLLYTSPFRFVLLFMPLIAVFFLSFNIQNLSTGAARAIFIAYSAMIGMSLSSIFLVFQLPSIAQTFFISAASFGALSLYGYTTKRDLRPLGAFLIIGLVGLLIAMVVNIVMMWMGHGSSALQFAISAIGVLIFAGLTAYDTQTIKEMYYEGDPSDTVGRKMVMGALNLYLDFINMFVFLLQLMGNRN